MKRIISFMVMAVLLVANALAKQYAPEDVPNVNKTDRTQFVSDPTNVLSPSVKSQVNKLLGDLRKQTSAEVAVAVVPSTGDLAIEDYAERVFTKWGLGKSDKDNGVLLLVASDDHGVRIQTGYGVEGILPDIAVARIIREVFIPAAKNGSMDQAVLETTKTISSVMTDPTVREELLSKEKDASGDDVEPLDADTFYGFLGLVVAIFFFASMYLFYTDVKSKKKGKKRDNPEKARALMSHMAYYWIMAFLSAGLGFIFLILAKVRVSRLRNKRRVCPECGHKMKKLNEKEDNEKLDEAQDLEERLKTVDYDVWVCPDCGVVERIPFRTNQNKYKECPKCHTVAERLESDAVIKKATTTASGTGVKTFVCEYCGNKRTHHYTIPKKESVAAAAGAVAGAMLSGGGSSGGRSGGFGGGFGGGSTGGGGASGHW